LSIDGDRKIAGLPVVRPFAPLRRQSPDPKKLSPTGISFGDFFKEFRGADDAIR
jgi:hypothetical protein